MLNVTRKARRGSESRGERFFALRLLFGLALVALLSFGTPLRAHAAGGPVGIGVILGDPTGFTLKARFADANALQLHLGFGFGDRYRDSYFVLHLDYLWHFLGLFPGTERTGILTPYVGFGGKVGFADHQNTALVGLRVPLGLSFFFRAVPLELFVEVALGINIVPEVTPLVDAGIGIRFYF